MAVDYFVSLLIVSADPTENETAQITALSWQKPQSSLIPWAKEW